jgi:multiple sugar transport system permease protein
MSDRDERRAGALFLLPALLALAMVALYPILSLFWLSMRQRILPFGINTFIGLDHYAVLFQTPRFWNSLGVTAYFAVLSVTIEVALGLGIALLLTESFYGVALARAFILLPWAIPTVVTAKLWDWMYHPDLGVLNFLIAQAGFSPINWLASPATAIHAAIIADIWKMTPFAVILILAGLAIVPHDLYRAASLDGASRWQAFRHITLPLVRPMLLVVVLFRLIDALRVFDLPYVLSGGGPADATETLSIYAYKMLFQTFQFGYGSAIGVVMFLLVALVSLCQLLLGRTDFARLVGKTP